MGNWEKQQDDNKDIRERDKVSRENLGKFFYDLAKLTFAAMVLGGGVSVFTDFTQINYWSLMSFGLLTTVFLANVGFKILKR